MPSQQSWTGDIATVFGRPGILFSEDIPWSPARVIAGHRHAFYQMDYFYAGTGRVVIDGESYVVQKGDVYLTNPGQRHQFLAARRKPMEGISFKFALGGSRKMLFPNFLANLCTLPARQHRDLGRYLRLACEEVNAKRQGHASAAASYLSLFFVLLARHLQEVMLVSGCGEGNDQSMQRVMDYIRRHCRQPVTLTDLGAMTGLTPRYLCQKFSKKFGVSPIAAVTLERMKTARELLTRTRLSVAEVGCHVGYDDVYHFSKRFKAIVGVSPRTFRTQSAMR